MDTLKTRANYKEQGHRWTAMIQGCIKEEPGILCRLSSSAIWQSPIGLGAGIVGNILGEENWNNLIDNPNEPTEIRQVKSDMRFGLVSTTAHLLYQSRAQTYATQLLVRQTLASTLPASDQDRLIAGAMLISYKRWLQLRSVLSTVDIPEGTRLCGIPKVYISSTGKLYCNLQFPVGTNIGNVSAIGLSTRQGVGVCMSGVDMAFVSSYPAEVFSLEINEGVMSRYDNILPQPEREQRTRDMILYTYGGLPVLKNISFGNGKQSDKEVPEGKLAWNT